MDDHTPKAANLSPAEATLDCNPQHASGAESSREFASGGGRCGQVALVEGSAPGLTRETQQLLRGRLRLAAALMFFGCLVFLPQHFFRADFSLPGSRFLFAFHTSVTVLLGVLGGLLCRRCQISMLRLRVAELAMFGLCAAFLVALQHVTILDNCKKLVQFTEVAGYGQGRLSFPAGLWLLLVFTLLLHKP